MYSVTVYLLSEQHCDSTLRVTGHVPTTVNGIVCCRIIIVLQKNAVNSQYV